jgi:type IV pilus assembly protein PilV
MQIPDPGGYTLIEVLVALCILSIAALGAAELQWQALAAIRQAALHGEALALASDVAERLRAMPDAESCFTPAGCALPAAIDCDELACSAAQLAAADLRAWLDAASVRLPAARLQLCADDAPWDAAREAFRWDCSGAGPAWVKLGWSESGMPEDAPRLLLLAGGGR